MIEEIKAGDLNPEKFAHEKSREISKIVGDGFAINALSGGVDSSAVTILGHRALDYRLKTYFVDNGLMREGEPQQIALIFKSLGINIEVVDAQQDFFQALKGIIDPEEKREAIIQTFYRRVFGGLLVRETGAKYLLQGTILTDIDETVAKIKRQHNVFEQLGIDPQEAFGYKIIEPLVQLRKDGVRKLAQSLGLPEQIYNRMPFPGPALAIRIIGEVTRERVKTVRKATVIVEEELAHTGAFQYMAILHQDRVTGMRAFGQQIQIRCWDSVDARKGTPTRLSEEVQDRLVERILDEVPDVVGVLFHRTPKPPSTIEAI